MSLVGYSDLARARGLLGASSHRRRSDPLSFFEFKNPKLRELVERIGEAEFYVHAANSAGKTTIGAALAIALLRGEDALAGVPLPRLKFPVLGALCVPSYKQAGPTTIAKLRSLLGLWPNHEAMVSGALEYVGMILVKHRRSTSNDKDREDWSRLYLFPHDGEIPEGPRFGFVWADEPAPRRTWEALRFRFPGEGWPFLAYTTATPIERFKTNGSGWDWYMGEDEFGPCLGRVVNGKIRLQTSIYDNTALHASDIEQAERAASSSAWGKARLLGEHVDASGDFPWAELMDVLDRWEGRCFAGEKETIIVRQPRDLGNDRHVQEVSAEVELWSPWDPADVYLLVNDLAAGIRPADKTRPDPKGIKDPLGMQLWSRRHRKLVGRYNGYLHPTGLGWLAAEMSCRYSQAPIDFENNAGWGDPFLAGVSDWKRANPKRRCGVIRRDHQIGKPDSEESALGWNTNENSRSDFMEAIRVALINDSCAIYSREVVSCLKHCVVDDRGKFVAGPGSHDEDLILAGRALHLIQSRPVDEKRVPRVPPSIEQFAEGLKEQFGRPVIPSRSRKSSNGNGLAW